MAKKILVFGEQRGGTLKKSVLEIIGLAKSISGGGSVDVVTMGEGIGSIGETLAGTGVAVHVADDASLAQPSPEAYVAQIDAAVKAVQPDVVLFTASAMGRDLAPRVAARMGAGFISECTSLEANGDGFAAKKSMYGGKVFATVESKAGAKLVATVKPGAHKAAESAGGGAANAMAVAAPSSLGAKVTSVQQQATDRPDLAEADVIVAGGRGLKEAENFKLIEDVATPLGAALGASRAIVDAGWVPHHYQVGQTGISVSPKLYIAIGISGAIQHLAGMRQSGCIVAINKDAEAPIFKVADYGLVGDAFEIAPLLAKELEKACS
ncbi:MAG: electron transfer flavoprotein subunit alpha/FixB family protein [Candidatus Eisenbacteria bacterium]